MSDGRSGTRKRQLKPPRVPIFPKEPSERKALLADIAPNLTPHGLDVVINLGPVLFDTAVTIYLAGSDGICRQCLSVKSRIEHGNNGSNPLRELRGKGFSVPKRPAKGNCPVHGDGCTLDRLPSLEPNLGDVRVRAKYSKAQFKELRAHLGDVDNFDGTRITSEPAEVDHRIPMERRAGEPEDVVDTTDAEAVRASYQILSQKHNALKRQKCLDCASTGKRPVFLTLVRYYAVGDENYNPSIGCRGCGWAFPEEHRAGLQSLVDDNRA